MLHVRLKIHQRPSLVTVFGGNHVTCDREISEEQHLLVKRALPRVSTAKQIGSEVTNSTSRRPLLPFQKQQDPERTTASHGHCLLCDNSRE